nr:MAG TPA: hypothetical protein [Bacteriophage sp.]
MILRDTTYGISFYYVIMSYIYKCMILIDYLCVYGGNIW